MRNKLSMITSFLIIGFYLGGCQANINSTITSNLTITQSITQTNPNTPTITNTVSPSPSPTITSTPVLFDLNEQNPLIGPINQDIESRIGRGEISRILYSADGNELIVSSKSGVYVYDLATKTIIQYFGIPTDIQVIGYITKENGLNNNLIGHLVGVSIQNNALWDMTTSMELPANFNWTNKPETFGLSNDGYYLVTADFDGLIRIWKTQDGSLLWSGNKFAAGHYSFAFSANNQWLVINGHAGDVTLFNLQSYTEESIQQSGEFDTAVAFSPDGNLIAFTADKDVKIWNLKEKKLLYTLKGHNHFVNDVKFSPDGNFIATSSYDRTVIIWRVKTGYIYRQYSNLSGPTQNLDFSPDSLRMSASTWEGTIYEWKISQYFPINEFHDFSGFINHMAMSPDGSIIAYIQANTTLNILDVIGKKLLFSIRTREMNAITFSNDGRYIVTGDWDGNVNFWNVKTGEKVKTYKHPKQSIANLSFSTDDTLLAVATTYSIYIREAASGKTVTKFNTDINSSIAFLPNSSKLAIGGDSPDFAIFDTSTYETINLHSLITPVEKIAVSPNGKMIALGGNHYPYVNGRFQFTQPSFDNLRIWIFTDGKNKQISLYGMGGTVGALAFSKDSHYLAIGLDNGNIVVFDTQQIKFEKFVIVKNFSVNQSQITDLFFSNDGNFLISSSIDGTIIFWKMFSQ